MTEVAQTPEPPAQPVQLKESNEERQRRKFRRKAIRAHDWRVRVWAQCELTIRQANASAQVLGGDPFEPWTPNFTDAETLQRYATMQITK